VRPARGPSAEKGASTSPAALRRRPDNVFLGAHRRVPAAGSSHLVLHRPLVRAARGRKKCLCTWSFPLRTPTPRTAETRPPSPRTIGGGSWPPPRRRHRLGHGNRDGRGRPRWRRRHPGRQRAAVAGDLLQGGHGLAPAPPMNRVSRRTRVVRRSFARCPDRDGTDEPGGIVRSGFTRCAAPWRSHGHNGNTRKWPAVATSLDHARRGGRCS